ncbi:MAG: hypothetical protein IPN02_12180 [Candidatus Microthrix sp.]|uniref:Uncharacterized protein n=1 Tax=Candidatus Neomicrothrix subdominans TaxID=2954438 RepID=A0A936NCQ4_9ACTN|nr:hypothetical protein [Candidatus Microthrix subdominans]
MSINTQQKLMVTASWNWFADVRHHEGFGPLAQLMGLDHTGSAQGRQLAENAAWERERRVSDQTKQPKSRRTFSWSAVPVDLKRALLADRDDEHRQVDAADDETLAGWLTERYGARPRGGFSCGRVWDRRCWSRGCPRSARTISWRFTRRQLIS